MDKYSLHARIYPMVIFFMPIIILGIFYSIIYKEVYQSLSSLGLTAVLTYFLSHIGRDRGKLKEPALWKRWGGMPSIQILRTTDNHLDTATKSRYILKLSQICPVQTTGNQAQDQDIQIQAWTKFLISHTRDTKKYPLLFKENMNYGFRRNLWALKGLSIGFIFICLAGNYLYQSIEKGFHAFSTFPASFYISESVLLLLLVVWIFVITSSWVKIPAFAYAERLLETSEVLPN